MVDPSSVSSGSGEIRQGLRIVRVCARRQWRSLRRALGGSRAALPAAAQRASAGRRGGAAVSLRDLLVSVVARLLELVTSPLRQIRSASDRSTRAAGRRISALDRAPPAGGATGAPTQDQMRAGQQVTAQDPHLARQVKQGLMTERSMIRTRKKREPR